MAYLNSLPEKSHLADVFRAFPKGIKPLLEYHDNLLRENSSLSIGERELIAAYVSGLNGCQFCYGSHVRIAEVYGIEPEILEKLLSDIDGAPIDHKMKSIFHYVKKLTLNPSSVRKTDVDDIIRSGWPEEAVYTVASICGLFNLMNRIVDGIGVSSETVLKKSDADGAHRSSSSYKDFISKIFNS